MALDKTQNSQRPDSSSAADSSGKRQRTWRLRLLIGGIFTIYLLLLTEVGARGFWKLRYGVPVFDMTQIWSMRFYPELHESRVLETSVGPNDEYYDVLLLGASVVSPSFGDIGEKLETQLSELTGRQTRVFNCAAPAHTTRDSLLKYQRLCDKHFDLVMVYHGINDARLNNCPPEMFRADYTHSAWYYRVAALDRHPELPYFVLPYTLEHMAVSVMNTEAFGWFLPQHQPLDGWSQHGEQVKTARAFRENLAGIVELAQERQTDVLMPSYAWHLMSDYTLAKFRNKQLDYGSHAMPVELIGTPRGVVAAVQEHNSTIRRLGVEHSNVVFVDLNDLMTKDGKHFDDVCHLTKAGCTQFVENLRQPLQKYLRRHGGENLLPSADQIIARQNTDNDLQR